MATDIFNNYFLTTADVTTTTTTTTTTTNNNNNNNNNTTTENNTTNINNNTFLNFMSQAFTTKYPCMNSKPTMIKETESIIKALKSKNSQGHD